MRLPLSAGIFNMMCPNTEVTCRHASRSGILFLDYVAILDVGRHCGEPGASRKGGSPRRTLSLMPHARGRRHEADFIGFTSTPMPCRLLRNRVPRHRAGRSIHRLFFVKEPG
jgi:hypothetical protein